MKNSLKLASLAALTAAIVALPVAATSMGGAQETCHPASGMAACGAKCAGKCAPNKRHAIKKHASMHAKCGAQKCAPKCGAQKCAPKCAAQH
ncbi:hypothetical protein RHOFW510R12_01660 [Rhodanobacter sp. FW510-R12]